MKKNKKKQQTKTALLYCEDINYLVGRYLAITVNSYTAASTLHITPGDV
jgi:hypothetical protein